MPVLSEQMKLKTLMIIVVRSNDSVDAPVESEDDEDELWSAGAVSRPTAGVSTY